MTKHQNKQMVWSGGEPAAAIQDKGTVLVDSAAIHWRIFSQSALIIAAGFWVFWPALHGDWCGDDSYLITNNYSLRSLHGLWKIWSATPSGDYWPITWTVLWIQWHCWGSQPLPYHLLNLGLHLSNAFLVWRLLGKLGLKHGWVGGLLFAIHPLAVESVAWITEIKNTLSLPFFLLSLEAYIGCDRREATGCLRSVIYYLAAMLSKTSVVMLPAVVLLYDWWKRGRITWREVRKTIPYFVIAAVLGSMTYYTQNGFLKADPIVDGRGMVARLSGAGVDVFFYLGKFLLPLELVPIYPRWQIEPPSLLQMATVPLLATLLLGLWIQRRGWGRHALLGFGFFLLTLFPALGIIKMANLHVGWVADHFVYLPMIGLIGLGVAGWEALHARISIHWRPISAGAMAGLAGLLAWESHGDAKHWINNEAMLSYTAKHNPNSSYVHYFLGNTAYLNNHFQLALSEYQAALRLDPNNASIHYSLGNTFLLFFPDHLSEAIFHTQEALRLRPGMTAAQYNLQAAMALQRYETARQMKVEEAVARTGLGNDFSKIPDRWPEAINQYEIALKLDPNCAMAHYNLGIFLSKMNGQTAGAISHLATALRIKPDLEPARKALEQLQAARHQ
jgi:tetratricopeptide (TPR) repeat protein